MPDRMKRNNIWFVVLFILMVGGGFCAIGFWQTYDLKCGGLKREWVWNTAPPKFQCTYG